MNNEKEKTDQALDRLSLYDFLYVLPMFFLFSYLPANGLPSILINLLIIILVGFGLAYVTNTIIYVRKKRK